MMITGIDHCALSVSDLERSIAFYRDIIGFELIRTLECPPESKLGGVVGLPNCDARIAHLKKGSMMLELFEYRQPRGDRLPADRTQADNGWSHLGFTSTDVRGDFADLSRQGVKFIGEPVEFRPEVWIVYFYGPDGEVCELRQTPVNDNS
jgi:catechol 2,3-dioxygenase-like lactoylglutathione lyase family enzyme